MALVAPEQRRRIRVIKHGVEPHFRPPESREQARQDALRDHQLDMDYFLVVGQNAPSKNHEAILRAFAAAQLADVKLVMLQRLYQRGRFGFARGPSPRR